MKRIFTLRLSFIIVFCSMIQFVNAQKVVQKTCGFEHAYFQLSDQHPDFDAKNRLEIQEDIKENVAGRLYDDTTTYVVRVVVHMIYLADTKYQNIPDEIIASQIDAMNRDFNLLNDYSSLRPEFVQFLGNARIQFKLADTDPNGNPTTGIERKKGELGTANGWGILTGENHKQSAKGGLDAWNTAKYLNIWVCDLNYGTDGSEGYLGGYAYFPSYFYPLPLFPRVLDGPTVDYRFFGQHNWFNQDSLGNSNRYGMGRTTVHELGHYLGLFHAWGNVLDPVNYSTGCVEDDEIKDTPNSKKPYAVYYVEPRNVCDTIVNSCNTQYNGIDYDDMFENYMDYSTDSCYSIFTQQQVKRMRNQLLKYRSGLIVDRFVTGIDHVTSLNNKIDVFPNPTNGRVFVKQNAGFISDIQVRVFNVFGEVVLEKVVPANQTNFELDLSGMAKSVYLINFSANGVNTTEKIMLQ